MSQFVDIPLCPLCDRNDGTIFYEEKFEARWVSDFITYYYSARVPPSVLKGEVFRIRHCGECDFYWHARVLNERAMASFYDDWIDPEASRAKQAAKSARERMHLCTLVMRWLGATPARALHPRVLDVGGGWGTFALCARALGCEAYVLESSEVRRRHVEALGLQTVTSLSKLEDESFELAVMNQSLEHIPQPVQLLKEIRRVLKTGGGLAVNVPYADPHHPVLAKGPFQPLEHVNGFTHRSLRTALTRAGLEVTNDYSRYTEFSARGVLGVALRNLKLRFNPAKSAAPEAGVACFGVRPSTG